MDPELKKVADDFVRATVALAAFECEDDHKESAIMAALDEQDPERDSLNKVGELIFEEEDQKEMA